MAESRTKTLTIAAVFLAIALFAMAQTLRCARGYMPNYGTFHDDGIYTVCAKSLAERHDYRIISLPMEPLETKYPPLMPVALSIGFLLAPAFPANVPVLETIACAVGLAAIWAAGALLVVSGRATVLATLLVVAASWLNLNLLSFLPVPMADLLFAALAAAAVTACERAAHLERLQPPPGLRRALASWLAVAAAVVAASFAHVMGVFLLLACLCYLLLQRLHHQAAALLALWALTVGSAWVWAGSHAATAPAVLVYYTNYPLAAKAAASHLGGPLPFMVSNLRASVTEVIDRLIPPLRFCHAADNPHWLAVLAGYGAVWALLLAGLSRELKARSTRKLLAIWLVVHGVMHLMWPKFAGERHLLVVIPFLYYYLAGGARLFARRLASFARPRVPLASAAPIVVLGLIVILNAVDALNWAGIYGSRVPPPAAAGSGYSEATEFHEAYRWINSNTRATDVIVWNNDPATYLFTGRHAIMSCMGENWRMIASPEKYITAGDLLESIKLGRGDYLVIDPVFVGGLGGFNQLGEAVREIMRAHPGSLAPVFTSRYGLITIFRIDRSRLPV